MVEDYTFEAIPLASNVASFSARNEGARIILEWETLSEEDLAGRVEQLLADRPGLAAMRRFAREEFENRYTAQVNYRALMTIYRQALGGAAQGDEEPACEETLASKSGFP